MPVQKPPAPTPVSRYTPADDLPQFLRVEEFAAWLGIGRSLAYQLAQQHGVRLGRHVRIPKAAAIRLASR